MEIPKLNPTDNDPIKERSAQQVIYLQPGYLGEEGEQNLIRIVFVPMDPQKQTPSIVDFEATPVKGTASEKKVPTEHPQERDIEDLGTEPAVDDTDRVQTERIPQLPLRILGMAEKILLAVGTLLVLSGVGYAVAPTQGMKEVWEFSKVFLPSVATLVLGYYFGKHK